MVGNFSLGLRVMTENALTLRRVQGEEWDPRLRQWWKVPMCCWLLWGMSRWCFNIAYNNYTLHHLEGHIGGQGSYSLKLSHPLIAKKFSSFPCLLFRPIVFIFLGQACVFARFRQAVLGRRFPLSPFPSISLERCSLCPSAPKEAIFFYRNYSSYVLQKSIKVLFLFVLKMREWEYQVFTRSCLTLGESQMRACYTFSESPRYRVGYTFFCCFQKSSFFRLKCTECACRLESVFALVFRLSPQQSVQLTLQNVWSCLASLVMEEREAALAGVREGRSEDI